MGFYKVRPNSKIGASGVDFGPGSIMELDDRMAFEVRDKVDACTEDGTLLSAEEAPLAALARAMPHERESLLQMEQKKLKAQLAVVEKALEAERAQTPVPEEPESAETPDQPDDAPDQPVKETRAASPHAPPSPPAPEQPVIKRTK